MASNYCQKKIVGGLLAAGNSERMGPLNKLLFEVNGVPMVRRIAVEMLSSALDGCYAVVGFESEKIIKALEDLPVKVLENERWKEGQGTSISKLASGLNCHAADLLIMLGDLPGVNQVHFNYLIRTHKDTEKSDIAITIPEFHGQKGNPVIWGRSYIPELKRLCGEQGGRSLFKKYEAKINLVEVSSECFISDLDTRESLDLWVKRQKKY